MQLTSFTDYGLRALIFLATLPEGEKTNISTITKVYGISHYHMVKIINKLSQNGYVSTVRGKNGGIRLGKAAQEIVIGQVVRKMESVQLVDCSSCLIVHHCRLTNALNGAVNCFLRELDRYTLTDLVTNNRRLYQTLLLASLPLDS